MVLSVRSVTAALFQPPELDHTKTGALGVASDLLMWGIVCGVPLAHGVMTTWPPERTLIYSLLAFLFLALTQLHRLLSQHIREHWVRWWGGLLRIGIIGFGLQSLNPDPLIQPTVFVVPLVYATTIYAASRVVRIAALYLLLMALGLWLSGLRDPEMIWFPVIGYGALMIFVCGCTHLLVQQASARQRSDQLALELALQREYLQRLVAATASLTRDLDPATVLEQVAAEGRALTRAAQACVWLRDPAVVDEARGPSLRLATAVPAAPAPLPPREAGAATTMRQAGDRLMLPLIRKGDSIGILELRAVALAPEIARLNELLQPFADAAAVAIENARLYEQAHLSATMCERNRLARELHDTIAQGLTALRMHAIAARQSLARDPERADAQLERVIDLGQDVLQDVRRSVWTLAAPLIDGAALSQTLDSLTRDFAARTGVSARYEHSGPPPALKHDAATQIVRIVQEALQNVEKHAHATEVVVELAVSAAEVEVCVTDNGLGFDPDNLVAPGTHGSGFGLIGLRERACLLRGMLHVESAPAVGARVTVTVPAP